MSLSARITLAIVVVVAVFVTVDQILQRFLVSRTFADLERHEGIELHLHARRAIESAGAQLGTVGCSVWADLEQGRRAGLEGSGLDLLVVLDAAGDVRHHLIEDPETRAPLELRRFPRGGLMAGHPLIAAGMDRGNGADEPFVSGLMETDAGILQACSVEFAGTDGGSGRLIAGSFLTPQRLADLTRDLEGAVELWPMASAPESALNAATKQELSAFPTELITRQAQNAHEVLGSVTTVLKVPSVVLLSRTRDRITEQGLRTAQFSMLSTVVVALAILLTLIVLLRRIVVRPLAELTSYALVVGRSENPDEPLDMHRADEIGLLADELRRMLQKLAASRQDVVRTARLAGMSEIAIGVLHNVGNALTSVGVSADQIRSRLSAVPVDDLRRVNENLGQHADDLENFLLHDPRGQQLPQLLTQIEYAIDRNLVAVKSEVGELEIGVERMRKLVAIQQNNAVQLSGVEETVVLAEEAEIALETCEKASSVRVDVEVERAFEDLPPATLDRYKLREVLVNLIRNGLQALDRSSQSNKRLCIAARRVSEHDFSIDVEDNGVGIAREDLARIFSLGFTTRPDGHGFGLHSAANAAREMNGRLEVHSEGLDRGARFSLVLPFVQAGGVTSAEAPARAA